MNLIFSQELPQSAAARPLSLDPLAAIFSPRSRLLLAVLVGGFVFIAGTRAEEGARVGQVFDLAGRVEDPPYSDARLHRIAELREEIAHHDRLYFHEAAPEISDAAYDRLKRELAALEGGGERPLPTETEAAGPAIGDDRSGLFPVHRHREPMLSLDKVYSETELRAWHARLTQRWARDDVTYVVEPKVDGLAVSVTYEHGRLIRAATRGDGREGDDITANVLAIGRLPRALVARDPRSPPPDLIELRGRSTCRCPPSLGSTRSVKRRARNLSPTRAISPPGPCVSAIRRKLPRGA